MTVETLNPNGDDAGWTSGGWADIDEGVPGDEVAVMTAVSEGEVIDLDLEDSAIADADTVNSVTVKLSAQTTGSGVDSILVDLLIGGVAQGTQQSTGALTGAFATYTLVDAIGWDIDWTAAQLDGMQIRLTSNQTGMPGALGIELDSLLVEVDWTVAPVGGAFPQQTLAQLGVGI